MSVFLVACWDRDDRYGFTTPLEVAARGTKTIAIDAARKVTSGTTISYLVAGSAFLTGTILNPGSFNSSTLVAQVNVANSK